jgi:kynurenine 3-monooxygenase
MAASPRVTIVGAGLGGSILSIYLARRGYDVQLFELRGDLRRENVDAGKSIKLTLAERGLAALTELGLADDVKNRICVPLRGRAVHGTDGTVVYQPYGKDEHEVIHSFSRTDLNSVLLDHAETYPNIKIHFHQRCVDIEKETATAVFQDSRTGAATQVEADFLVGADGAFSIVRQRMQRRERADYRQDFLPWGYKELNIEIAPEGMQPMDKYALHIWPCGDHMLFALPNVDGSFNGVCVLPFTGEHSFDSLLCDDDVIGMFRTRFGDALPFMPNLLQEWNARSISEFVTIRTSYWHHKGKVVIIGDAAHSVVPFYGQGMNAAFEDCSTLDKCIERNAPGDWQAVFREFEALRKPNTDVLAQLSVDNFHELRDTVRRPIVTARKSTSIFLNRLFRQHSVPIYTMISHSTIPYAECVERHKRQERIARWFGMDLIVGAVALNVRIKTALAHRRAARLAEAAAARGAEQIVVPTVAVPLPALDPEPETLPVEPAPEPETVNSR